MAQKIIRMNRGAGGDMGTGEGIKLNESCTRGESEGSGVAQKIIRINRGAGDDMGIGKIKLCRF